MATIDPADCVWPKANVTYNSDLSGAVIDSHITYVCTTSGHMSHERMVPGDARGKLVRPL